MKQVIIINNPLALTRGKLANQVAKASLSGLFSGNVDHTNKWLASGMSNAIFRAPDERTLIRLVSKADALHIPAELIRDTNQSDEVSGDITCLRLGPATTEAIDSLTKDLELF